ncbi:MAG: hypothetical protein Alpg2KO_23130 [Alphaproteobacteria bacterium]
MSTTPMPPSHSTADLARMLDLLLGHLHRDGMDLTVRQMTILLIVFMQDGPHTVAALSRKLKVPKPAITRSVDRLEREGLVRKVKDKADKRIVHVTRTMTGVRLLLDMQDASPASV